MKRALLGFGVKRPSKHAEKKGPQMSHRNAPLTPEGRRRLCERVDAGQPIAHVAEAAGVSRTCLTGWYRRWREHGEAGLRDRSSRPGCSPRRTPAVVEDRIELLRREQKL